MKQLQKPIKTIVDLMKGVCIILKIEPVMVPDPKETQKVMPDWWLTSIGGKVLGNKHIVRIMTTTDPTKLDPDVMKQFELHLERENLTAKKVSSASVAAKGIFAWLMAVRNYYFVYRNTEPIRDKLIFADL